MPRPAPLSALPAVTPSDLVGTWHIVQTNFPMWLAGDKLAPRFVYGATDRPDRLADCVRYRTRSGAEREIRGVDTHDPAEPAHFTWRGVGLLALLRSDWYVVHHDAGAGILAIHFTRTLFTPAGVDVVARDASPSPSAVEAARRALQAAGLGNQVATLVSLG